MAGEASADLHGSNLVSAMKRHDPDIVFWGIGGNRMAHAGVRILTRSSDMAVVGLTEVFRRIHTIIKASARLKSILRNRRPDLLILIDYPDFNIHIAGVAKRYNIPVLYYISPQIWAWRSGRVRKIARRVDRMAVILPFEKEFYSTRGVQVDYVGHPLLDICPDSVNKKQARFDLDVGNNYPVVGILPGSRKEEIRNLLPVMVESVRILNRRYADMQCLLPLAQTIRPEFVQPFIEGTGLNIKIFSGDNIYNILSACDIAVVTSGTATLETAIMGVPMVVIYKGSKISYMIVKRMVKVSHISLANLVAGEEVVPELIQDEVTPEGIAKKMFIMLEERDTRENIVKKLGRIRGLLGEGGASERTAKIALDMMGVTIGNGQDNISCR